MRTKFQSGNLKGMENLEANRRIILKAMLNKNGVRVKGDLIS